MRAALAWLGLTAAIGCVAPALPGPQPESVRPDHGASDTRVPVEIRGQFRALVRTDFSDPDRTVLDATFRAELMPASGEGEAFALEDVRFQNGDLACTVPAGLALGSYDLRVVGPDGAEGLLSSAYRSVTSAENVAAIHVDAVGDQRAGQPFVVHATALDSTGRVVDGFDSAATVSELTGIRVAASFQRGRLRAELVLAGPRASDVIAVADDRGRRGTSEPFDVAAGLPAALALDPAAPDPIEAGACAGPVEVRLVDAWQGVPELPAAAEVALEADPPELVFYGDGACAQPVSGVGLDPVTGAARFFARGVVSGPHVMRLSTASVPSAALAVEVRAGPAYRVALAGFPPRPVEGACYPLARVELQDFYGNPSGAGTPLPLALHADPEGGLALYVDAQCAQPLEALELAPGQTSATVPFQALLEGRHELSVAAPGTALLPATLVLQVQSP